VAIFSVLIVLPCHNAKNEGNVKYLPLRVYCASPGSKWLLIQPQKMRITMYELLDDYDHTPLDVKSHCDIPPFSQPYISAVVLFQAGACR
jgi:hypothetical protein